VIDLPAPLVLPGDLLGLLRPAFIGGIDVHVVLPNFKAGKTVLHPRAKVDWVSSFAQKRDEDDRGWPFGRAFGAGAGREASVTRLLVLPKNPITSRQARKMHMEAENWVQLLELWIEVIARTDLHRERVTVERTGQSAYVWVDRGKSSGELLKGKHRITFDFSDELLEITPRVWGRILARASSGDRPPEAHVFLRDGRSARNAGQYRRSVLDSATAAELALAKIRDDELAGSRRRFAHYVRERSQQINRLTEFLSAMDRKIPSLIQQEIAEPRNKAIHEGHKPDESVATAALAKAEEVVGLAFPWKNLA
jgi:hypothetical protein